MQLEAISAANFYGDTLPRPFVVPMPAEASATRRGRTADQPLAQCLVEGRRKGGVEGEDGRQWGVLSNNAVLLDFARKVDFKRGGLKKGHGKLQVAYGEYTAAQREKMALASAAPANFTPSSAITEEVRVKQKRASKTATRKRDPRKPKKALSAFQYFCKEKRVVAAQSGKAADAGSFLQEASAQWKALSAKAKDKYERLHAVDKARYDEAAAAWRTVKRTEKAARRSKRAGARKMVKDAAARRHEEAEAEEEAETDESDDENVRYMLADDWDESDDDEELSDDAEASSEEDEEEPALPPPPSKAAARKAGKRAPVAALAAVAAPPAKRARDTSTSARTRRMSK